MRSEIAPGDVEVCFAGDGFEGDGAIAAPENFSFDAPVDAWFGGVFDAHSADGPALWTFGFDPKVGEPSGAAEDTPFFTGEGVRDVFAVGRGAGLAATSTLEGFSEQIARGTYPTHYQ